ncbi:MAG: DUF362 domain-containing protein [Patescibacteria group bacterium]
MTNIVAKTKASGDLKADILKILQPLGGISIFIKPGDKVLLKPNLNTADPYPASSDPKFLRTVIEIVKEAKPSEILIGDSCTLMLDTGKVMACLNFSALEKDYGVRAINFDHGGYIKKKIPGKYLKSISIPAVLEEVDKLILLPCLKVHRFARFTMSLKLGVGIMKKIERTFLHMNHLEEKIAEINLAYTPALIIMDGRKAFITHGPDKGDLVEPNILMAGTDRVAMDVEGLKILKSYPAKNKLNFEPWEFPTIKRAAELNLGAKSERDYQIINM